MSLKKHFIVSVFVLVLGLVVSVFSFLPSQASAEQFDWAKKIGGATNEYAYSSITDLDGNVYVSGGFSGTVDFDPGEGDSSLTSAGNSDVFILKLAANGDFVWVKQIGNIGNDSTYSMAFDGNGNLCVAGAFSGTVNFNPNGEVFSLVSSGTSDIFINKLSSDGNFIWAKQLGSLDGDNESMQYDSIAVDQEDGSVYTTGYFAGTADFDPGAGTANLTAPQWGRSMFISKLDTNGDFAWVKKIDTVYSYSIDLNPNGDVYVTGIFSGTKNFDPGAGIANLISTGGSNDVFILKLASNGDFVWVKQIGGTGTDDDARSAVVDQGGNIYTVGTFANTVDFNPGAGDFSLTSAGGSDVFISKLDINGNFVWAKQIGGITTSDRIHSISLGSNGYFYITGEFGGTVDFDPGEATSNLITASDYDIFISKLDTDGNFVWAKQFGQTGYEYANSITANSNEDIYIIGRFNGTVDFNPGSEGASLISTGYEDILILKLTPASNLTAYTEALSAVTETDYTTASWTIYQAVVDGNPVTGSDSQIAVDTATNNITTAQSSLVLLPDETPPTFGPHMGTTGIQGGTTIVGVTVNDNVSVASAEISFNNGVTYIPMTETLASINRNPPTPTQRRYTYDLDIPEDQTTNINYTIRAYDGEDNSATLEDTIIVTVASVTSISIVNIASDGTQENDGSNNSSISSTGRYIAFDSFASNLVSNDTNGRGDCFVRDTQTNTTTLVSVSFNGTQGNNESQDCLVSGNGRYVVFDSLATNLVEGDTNRQKDIFLRDTVKNTTIRVNVATDGTQGNNRSYIESAPSDDGRYVVFSSNSTNLVPNDTNDSEDVFVRDTVNNITTRINVSSNGTQGNGEGNEPSISPDGNYVVYYSEATNLVENDTNGIQDVFVYNILTHATTRVSVSTDGTQQEGEEGAYDLPFITSGGRYVAFDSGATNLVEGDTNVFFDAFIRDTVNNITTRINVSSNGTQGNGDSYSPMVSNDGRYVLFYSEATNLVPNDTNDSEDVFVRDMTTNTTARVSVSYNVAEGDGDGNSSIYYKSISDDGQYITFYSYATNLVEGDINGIQDIFLVTNPLYVSSISIPTLTTDPVTDITATGATFNAIITDKGGEDPTLVGFKYGKTNTHGTDVGGGGDEDFATFSSIMTNLTCNTTYYVEAFAENSTEETAFGGDVTFTTLACHSRVIGSSGGAVRQFQTEQQVPPTTPVTLPVTPVITPTPSTTGTPLNLTRTLKLNMKGDDVKTLQVYLNTHGFKVSISGAGSLGNETTFFGPRTKLAVIAFQKANGLTPDGIVGPKTLEKMK